MPEERYWESLFDVPLILDRLGINSAIRDVAELGCGYGTFTLPIARAIRGTIYTFDIDTNMVGRTQERVRHAGANNVVCRELDVMEHGFDVPNPVDVGLLFNILHCEEPERLLGHAATAVRRGGRVLVIHWRCDPTTPRGPTLDIRPKPEQIVLWAATGGQLVWQNEVLQLPPWHYGLDFGRV